MLFDFSVFFSFAPSFNTPFYHIVCTSLLLHFKVLLLFPLSSHNYTALSSSYSHSFSTFFWFNASTHTASSFFKATNKSMRTPLNRTQVNSLLLHLPQRTNLSQPLHLRDDHIGRLLHLPLLGEPRDSEPNRRVRQFIRHAQRPHHIRRLQRRAGARRPRGHRDIGHGHDQRLALHAGERQIHVSRPPMLAIAVQRHIRQLRLAPRLALLLLAGSDR